MTLMAPANYDAAILPDLAARSVTGIYAQVDTVKRAQYWEGLGADGIVLQSHTSGDHSCFSMDFPIIQCQYARLTDPKLMIAAGWIRPEDLGHYEALGFSTVELVKRAEAYHSRRFDGNLAELIFSWGFREKAPDFDWVHFLTTFRPWKTSMKSQKAMIGFLGSQGMLFPKLPGNRPPIEIRNEALPKEFLEWFKRKNCADTDCDACRYCEKVARTAVRLGTEFLDQVLPLYEKVQADLIDGAFLPGRVS